MKKLVLLLSMALSGLANAQNSTSLVGALPAPIQLAVQGGMRVENKFAAAGNLTGWILAVPGSSDYRVAFTPPTGDVVIAGVMRNAAGDDLTQQYIEEYAPKHNLDAYWPRLANARTINQGAQGNAVKSTVYAFFDPNCVYCHFVWEAFQPYMKAGLQVRWVTTGVLGGDSPAQAAALLSSKDPAAALDQHERTWNPRNGVAGVAPLATIPAAIKSALDANARLLNEMSIRGTPALVYRDTSGRVRVLEGMPKLNQLPSITGLPAIKNTDRNLDVYER